MKKFFNSLKERKNKKSAIAPLGEERDADKKLELFTPYQLAFVNKPHGTNRQIKIAYMFSPERGERHDLVQYYSAMYYAIGADAINNHPELRSIYNRIRTPLDADTAKHSKELPRACFVLFVGFIALSKLDDGELLHQHYIQMSQSNYLMTRGTVQIHTANGEILNSDTVICDMIDFYYAFSKNIPDNYKIQEDFPIENIYSKERINTYKELLEAAENVLSTINSPLLTEQYDAHNQENDQADVTPKLPGH